MTGSVAYRLATLTSPLGPLQAIFSERGLRALDFLDTGSATRRWQEARKVQSQERLTVCESAVSRAFGEQLSAYFDGELRAFEIPLDLQGTPFQRKAWAALQEIPYGETWSYARQAERIGCAKAARAVGAANGKNPISLVIPCHRVIAGNCRLAGYGGGVERKAFLLDLEKRYTCRSG